MQILRYRRGLKHPFPAAVHDCLNVTKHLLAEGHRYGIDVNRIGVAGDIIDHNYYLYSGFACAILVIRIPFAKRITGAKSHNYISIILSER